MTSLKRLLGIKALLLIIICLSMVQMTWGQKPAVSAKPETRLITREHLRELGRSLANCLDDSKPCKNTFGANELVIWLTNSTWRNSERAGLDTLDFSDFTALHKKYGDALAKLHSYTLEGVTHQQWAWNVTFEDGNWAIIVVDDCPSQPLRRIYNDPPYSVRRPNPCLDLLEIPVQRYAATLAELMADNENGRVTVNQFVNFMINKQ